MDDQKTFGHILRSIRSARDWSQSDLAAATELSVDAISNLERGKNQPSYATLQSLAHALGIPASDFFTSHEGSKERSSAVAQLLAYAHQLDDDTLMALVDIAEVLKRRFAGPK